MNCIWWMREVVNAAKARVHDEGLADVSVCAIDDGLMGQCIKLKTV